MRKRILMLNFEFPPMGGGAGNANYFLLEELAKAPYLEVDLVTSSAKNRFELDTFSEKIKIYKLRVNKKELHYWRMAELLRWSWKSYWLTKSLVNKNGYDLCHCWFGWPSGVIGYLMRKDMPYIVALRGSDVPGYSERLKVLDRIFFKFVSKLVWKNAKAVTALSQNLKRMAEKTFTHAGIQIIYNGVDLEAFKPAASGADRGPGLNILYAGRLIRRKGLIHLLEAFKRVSEQDSGCRLTIVGEGPERATLEAFSRHKGIEGKTQFLGAVEPGSMPSAYQSADIFVLPSLEEALGNVVLEAMACGLPVITTDTGASELMDGNGFVIERGSTKSIEGAIMKYVRNADLRARHGRRSREIAQEMSWRHTAQAYVRLYDRIK